MYKFDRFAFKPVGNREAEKFGGKNKKYPNKEERIMGIDNRGIR